MHVLCLPYSYHPSRAFNWSCAWGWSFGFALSFHPPQNPSFFSLFSPYIFMTSKHFQLNKDKPSFFFSPKRNGKRNQVWFFTTIPSIPSSSWMDREIVKKTLYFSPLFLPLLLNTIQRKIRIISTFSIFRLLLLPAKVYIHYLFTFFIRFLHSFILSFVFSAAEKYTIIKVMQCTNTFNSQAR